MYVLPILQSDRLAHPGVGGMHTIQGALLMKTIYTLSRLTHSADPHIHLCLLRSYG